MTHPSQAKGDRAEREVQKIIRDATGELAPRMRLTSDDLGDLQIKDCVIQVKSYVDVVRAMSEAVAGCLKQQAAAGTRFGASFVRRPGGRYYVVLDPEQFFALWREATS